MPVGMSEQHYPERWVGTVAYWAILQPFNSFGLALYGKNEAIIAQLNSQTADVKSNRPEVVAEDAPAPVADINMTWRDRQVITGKNLARVIQQCILCQSCLPSHARQASASPAVRYEP